MITHFSKFSNFFYMSSNNNINIATWPAPFFPSRCSSSSSNSGYSCLSTCNHMRSTDMGISVNGQSCVPPGFRFHPTEEELLNYYLKKKVACQKIDLDVIRDIDLNKLEPWDIQDKCRIGSTPQNEWYFFSHKDKKYPTGTRTNRATAAGFWKATGRDKVIYTRFKRIGMRKTLVFYSGRAPHGLKSDWIMHEYRLDDHLDTNTSSSNASSLAGDATTQEEAWVVCRVFKKKSCQTAFANPHSNSSIISNSRTQLLHSCDGEPLDQILQYLGRSCKQESDAILSMDNNMKNKDYVRPIETALSNMKLPTLESPSLQSLPSFAPEVDPDENKEAIMDMEVVCNSMMAFSDWPSMNEEINGSQIGSGSSEAPKQTPYINEPSFGSPPSNGLFSNSHDCRYGDGDPWSFMQSVSSGSDYM